MSTNLPTEAQAKVALATMAEQVYGPAFFEKLASYGITPANEAQAKQLLELGAVLEKAEADGRYKSAAAAAAEETNPFLDHVLTRIKGALNDGSTKTASDSQLTASAKAAVAGDANIKQAALIFAHVMAGGQVA